MMNLLKETLDILKSHDKSPSDVLWVGTPEASYLREISGHRNSPAPFGSWAEFEKFADFAYDEGFGGANVNGDLLIVGEDWWLERGEYDGSEWWEFKTLPQKPPNKTQLRPTDLSTRWGRS